MYRSLTTHHTPSILASQKYAVFLSINACINACIPLMRLSLVSTCHVLLEMNTYTQMFRKEYLLPSCSECLAQFPKFLAESMLFPTLWLTPPIAYFIGRRRNLVTECCHSKLCNEISLFRCSIKKPEFSLTSRESSMIPIKFY